MEARKWYNTEMNEAASKLFRDYLREHDIQYEASEVYRLTHFECYMTEDEVNAANQWMLENDMVD